MNTEGFDQWFKMNKNWSAPFGEWNRVSIDFCRRLAQQNLELASENLSQLSDQLRRLSAIEKPEELINFHRECLSQNITAAVESAQRVAQTTLEGVEEMAKLYGSSVRENMYHARENMAQARENMSQAAHAAKQHAATDKERERSKS